MNNFEPLLSFKAPGPAPAGLAWDGRSLWLNDYRQGRLYCLDTESGRAKDSLLCAGIISGLCWDGRSLWQSRLDEPWLQQINPVSHDIDQTLAVRGYSRLTDLAWDGENLWAVAQQSGELVIIDRETGQGLSQHSAPVGASCLGFHQDRIWLAYPYRMSYDQESDAFQWSGGEHRFILTGIERASGRELIHHELPFLPMGLTWANDRLWLSDPTSARLVCYQLT